MLDDMIYLTIIICVCVVSLAMCYCVFELSDVFREDRRRGMDEIRELGHVLVESMKVLVWGQPQRQGELVNQIMEEESEEDDGFPPHETDDEFLNWLPNEPDARLIPLPDHEQDDTFMNTVEEG